MHLIGTKKKKDIWGSILWTKYKDLANASTSHVMDLFFCLIICFNKSQNSLEYYQLNNNVTAKLY